MLALQFSLESSQLFGATCSAFKRKRGTLENFTVRTATKDTGRIAVSFFFPGVCHLLHGRDAAWSWVPEPESSSNGQTHSRSSGEDILLLDSKAPPQERLSRMLLSGKALLKQQINPQVTTL